jgi:hypothetical protein
MEGVRRNSAFCVGVLVEATGTALSAHFMQLLQWLYPLCTRQEAQQTSDMGGADIDNALSSVARMIAVAQAQMPLDRILPVMVASLPLRSDHSEGPNVYGCLCRLVLAGDAVATSAELLPKLVEAFAQVFYPTSKATDETKVTVKSCLRLLTSQNAFLEAVKSCRVEVGLTIENVLRSP